MKNTRNMLVAALMAMTFTTYANANTTAYTVEEKVKVTGLNKALPTSLPVLESPAPQKAKNSIDTNNHSASQKAAIVGLQLKSVTK